MLLFFFLVKKTYPCSYPRTIDQVQLEDLTRTDVQYETIRLYSYIRGLGLWRAIVANAHAMHTSKLQQTPVDLCLAIFHQATIKLRSRVYTHRDFLDSYLRAAYSDQRKTLDAPAQGEFRFYVTPSSRLNLFGIETTGRGQFKARSLALSMAA